MYLSEICIKRPVFASVVNIILVLVGLVCFNKISVREYPDISKPLIIVDTYYLGASPEVVEEQITNVLEEELAGINGVEEIISTSDEGESTIKLKFSLKTDLERAANDVRAKVARERGRLPIDANEPVIIKGNEDDEALIYIGLSSDNLSSSQIYNYADSNLKPRLQAIDGVGAVEILGWYTEALRILPNLRKMAALHISARDIEETLKQQDVELPTGKINGDRRNFSIIAKSRLKTLEDFRALPVKDNIRLGDIAKVEFTPSDNTGMIRLDGKTALALAIKLQAMANPITVADGVYKKLEELKTNLPKGLKLNLSYDKAVFIKASIHAVYKTIVEAVILVLIIIYLFLGNWRSTIIPIISIPISLIGGVALMFYMDFSINILSMLAVVLAVGLVVDDSIVVLENIHRHIERGLSPFAAALKGSKEIGFAIIAITLTLIAVFVPIGFMEGITGKLFTEFAWTLAFAVGVSGFTALTLSPMLCSKLLSAKGEKSYIAEKFNYYFSKLQSSYEQGLAKLLIFKFRYIFIILLIFAGIGGYFYKSLPSQLAPTEDSGVVMGWISGMEGDSIEKVNEEMLTLEEKLKQNKFIDGIFTAILPNSSAFMFLRLTDWGTRPGQQEIIESLMPIFMSSQNINAFPFTRPPFGSLGGDSKSKALTFDLMGHVDYSLLWQKAEEMVQKLQSYPEFTNVELKLDINQPRLALEFNREKLNMLGITPLELASTINQFIAGKRIGYYNKGSKLYDVVLQLESKDRRNPSDITELYIPSKRGEMIQLSSLVNIKEEVSSSGLRHFMRMRSVTINADLRNKDALEEAMNIVRDIGGEILPPGDITIFFRGQAREMANNSRAMFTTFLLALLFIYLVLAAQFESFIDPFIIILSVPLSVIGGIFLLKFSGGSLNIYSQIGFISLIGLITKNAILIIEFTNKLLEEGKELLEAIVESARLRLRPILMTSIATIMGAVPLAFASGPGSASRHDIGWVVIGGMGLGTIFTIFIIPVIIALIKRNKVATIAAN